ncbi:hypothetical protein LI99_12200 [Mycolicibacterium smegmatis]|uniref:Uncharacterized protein n=2 Tax=Mycolicibacterium smegmatis (strain ATCC 700084 / mc(2)155) TaxID=246196 RepID=A0QV54_MYCS2|nr:hypothetical protein MSMEG_2452 [Mycolicibacterium smegmatis MC2 155]AIU14260.1 hypothetical protein LI99_12200 [Mycolicibacterium smegmatis]AFP38858.1 hypothetical protein MSMEI_2390 [Mycolicibacterium smegmatis MC2 155]AIU07635.1 hypothetical protein LJ00_12200 [Mycolicibacterium smegmatis MC2 155]AIU20883.1 hypothetical protein LI98_12205 [Mycolicibacterium smegmatis]
MSPDVELIGVPFDGYGRLGNQARAAEALRSAGIAGAFGAARSDRTHPRRPSARGGFSVAAGPGRGARAA